MSDIRIRSLNDNQFEDLVKAASKNELKVTLRFINDELEWCQTMYKIKSTPNYKYMTQKLLNQQNIVIQALANSYEDQKKIYESLSIVNQYRD